MEDGPKQHHTTSEEIELTSEPTIEDADTPEEHTNLSTHELDSTSVSPNQRIAELKTKDAQKILTLRQRLGLIPGRISDWLNSKEGHPKTNILYRDDRMYRCIGPTGYHDFIDTGSVGSRDKNRYQDVSFNVGEPAPRYMKDSSGDFILEATPESANFEFKINPYSPSGKPMKDIPYRSCPEGALTKESAIRIFRRMTDDAKGSIYEVVFDNIGDQALLE